MENTNNEKYRLYLFYNRDKESGDIPEYLEDEGVSEDNLEKNTEEQIKHLTDSFKNSIECYPSVIKVEQIEPGDYIITVDTTQDGYDEFEDNMEEEFGRYGNIHGWGYGEFIDYSLGEIGEEEEKELLKKE
jgi:hypothetical protein